MILFTFASMSKKEKRSRPLFWFYILVAYIILQFSWWTYSMVKQNNKITHLEEEMNVLKGNSLEEVVDSGNELNKILHRRWIMITGEGTVFFSLLLFGIFQIRKSFNTENELAQQQKNFLLSVTHELKSPIASAKLQLQTLQKRELDRAMQKEIIGHAIADTDRLNTLVENILMAAKIDNAVASSYMEECNISDYIGSNLKQNIDAVHYQQKIVLDIEPNIFMSIDKLSFPSIIINLFENAIKYSAPESTITVVLKKKNDKIVFAVKDEGWGISEEDKTKIFQKFYRVGSEDTRKTKGTGLGLFIVQYLVKQHQGNIVVKNNTPKGSIFEVTFDIQAST